MELWKYYRILYRRKWIIIAGMILCVGAATVLALRQKDTFTFECRLMERTPSYAGQTVLSEVMYSSSQPEMRLANLARIGYSPSVAARVLAEVGGTTLKDPADLMKQTMVLPDREAQVLRVLFSDEDPTFAQAVASAWAREVISFYEEKVYDPQSQTRYLEAEVKTAKAEVASARQAVEEFKRANDLSNLDFSAQARITRVSEMESQMRSAEVLAREAEQRLASSRSELAKIPQTREESRTTSDNTLWLNLTNELNATNQQLAAMRMRRGENHPEVKALKEAVAKIEAQMANEERTRLVQRVETVNPIHSNAVDRYVLARIDAASTKARVAAARAIVPQMKAELARFPENERQLAALSFEQRAAESTYALLRQKLDESKIRQNEPFKTGIQWIDGPVQKASSGLASSKKLKVALALPLSILLSCAFIFLLNYMDNTVRTPEETEELLGLPVAAMVPIGRGHSLIRGRSDPGLRESYQMLSASLWHQRELNGNRGGILVASAEPNSGRTVTAGNLAAALAGDGARVILVDADMRQPAQHLVFGVDNNKGLTNILAGAAALEDVAVPTKVEGLLLIPSGPLPENPIRLLRGDGMRQFLEDALSVADFVIFDSPAGAAFADATILASMINKVLMVQAAGRVPRGAELEFKSRLEQVGADFIGVVLNKIRPEDSHGVHHFRASYAGLPSTRTSGPGAVPPTSPAIPG